MSESPTRRLPPLARRVFCNRTLNLRGIRAIGCDMDYTLVHYHHDLWEQTAYSHVQQSLAEADLPVAELVFDGALVTRGLILDLELGNLIKCSRFGYVVRAMHGTQPMPHDVQRKVYARTLVDLSEPRWVFLNTLFSLSEGCLFAQLVDLLDAGRLAPQFAYRDLYELVQRHMGIAHTEGALKAEIMKAPDRFVVRDPELPLALLDLKHAGKRLMVITNSEWEYTRAMMAYAFDSYLPRGMTWRQLFDLVIVAARKPLFFEGQSSAFVLEDEQAGLFRPTLSLASGRVHLGGHARMVEQHLGVRGEEILYVGDHMYADVHVSKDILRWRTALVLRELEEELAAELAHADDARILADHMAEKGRLEHYQGQLRVQLQRLEIGYGPPPELSSAEVHRAMQATKQRLLALDGEIVPLVQRAGARFNANWGPLMRAGQDKSRMARMVERYADVYTSRVANLLAYGPFAYLRAPGGSLPHDT